jgi:hypothetical protein
MYNYIVSGFSPFNVGTIKFWLDGADPNATGVAPAVDSTLATWTDKSVNAVVPTLSGGGTLTFKGTNSGKGVNFDGNSYLTLPNGTLPSGTGSFTYFYVSKVTNNYETTILTTGTSNIVNAYPYSFSVMYNTRSDNTFNLYYPYLTTGAAPANNTTFMSVISYNSSTNTLSFSFNAGTPATSAATLNLNNDYQRVGGGWDGGAKLIGNMCELIAYSSVLGTTDRQSVEGYLAWKWGFNASLPPGHPYYSAQGPTYTPGIWAFVNSALLSYTPTTSGNWVAPVPSTISRAIDRIAAAVSTLRTSAIP